MPSNAKSQHGSKISNLEEWRNFDGMRESIPVQALRNIMLILLPLDFNHPKC